MSSENVQELISLLLDRKLPDGEREKVLAHTRWCRECSGLLETLQEMRAAPLAMAPPQVPPVLSDRLRVLASHERSRQFARMNFSTRLQHWSEWIRLAFDKLMRPVALPFTVGIASALLVFSLLVPNLSFPPNHSYEPPLAVAETDVQWGNPDGKLLGATADHARLLRGSAHIDGILFLDERGRVQDFYPILPSMTADPLWKQALLGVEPAPLLKSANRRFTSAELFQATVGAGLTIAAPFVFSLFGRLFDRWRARRNGVKLAPGCMLLRWSLIVFSSKAFERVIQPAIADMQFEYFEALRAAEQALKANDTEESKRQLKRARVASVRGYFVFAFAAAGVVLTFLGSIVKMWKSAH